MQHFVSPGRLAARSAPKRVRAFSLLFALGLGACASGTSGAPVAPAESGLRRAESCEDLLGQLRADAEAKVNAEAERLLADYAMYRDGDILGWPRPGFDSGGAPVGAPNGPEDDGAGDPEKHVAAVLARVSNLQPHKFERVRPNGTVLEIRGNPLPEGGFVTSYADITSYKNTAREQALKHLGAFEKDNKQPAQAMADAIVATAGLSEIKAAFDKKLGRRP